MTLGRGAGVSTDRQDLRVSGSSSPPPLPRQLAKERKGGHGKREGRRGRGRSREEEEEERNEIIISNGAQTRGLTSAGVGDGSLRRRFSRRHTKVLGTGTTQKPLVGHQPAGASAPGDAA